MAILRTIEFLAVLIIIVPFLAVPAWIHQVVVAGFGLVIFSLAFYQRHITEKSHDHTDDTKDMPLDFQFDIERAKNNREIT